RFVQVVDILAAIHRLVVPPVAGELGQDRPPRPGGAAGSRAAGVAGVHRPPRGNGGQAGQADRAVGVRPQPRQGFLRPGRAGGRTRPLLPGGVRAPAAACARRGADCRFQLLGLGRPRPHLQPGLDVEGRRSVHRRPAAGSAGPVLPVRQRPFDPGNRLRPRTPVARAPLNWFRRGRRRLAFRLQALRSAADIRDRERRGIMSTIESPTQQDTQASAPALPDAPVALLRLDDGLRIVAANRSARDLLGLEDTALPVPAAGPLWGLQRGDLADGAGVWAAPGDDPARRLRYQADGEGWIASLPHAETATLLREAAGMAAGGGAVTHPLLAPLAQRLAGAEQPRELLAAVNEALARCDLALQLPPAQAASEAGRRLAAGF